MKTKSNAQCTGNNKTCIKEALETLSKYKADPFTNRFMEKFNLPVKAGPAANRDEIKKRTGRKSQLPNCNDLLEYVDELKMYGKQHVVLFSLKRNEKNYLLNLGSPIFVKQLLRRARKENRYNYNICRYKSNKPFLSEVKHFIDEENTAKLQFKWIETRRYEKIIQKKVKTLEERSVNFFIVNLNDGSAQLRIQQLQPNSLLNLKEEIDLYKIEMSKLLDLKKFEVVSLAPIMLKFLYKSILPIRQYSVMTKSGRFDGAPRNPTILKKLIYPFKKILPTEIKLCWRCNQVVNQNRAIHFILRTREDAITFPAKTDKLRIDFILNKIYKSRAKRDTFGVIKMKELNILAAKFPEDRLVIQIIDRLFQKSKNEKITTTFLASKTWFGEDDIAQIFNNATKEFPKKFVTEKDGDNLIFRIKTQSDFEFNGIADKIIRRMKDVPTKKYKKAIVQWSVGPGIGSILFILEKIVAWVIEQGIDDLFGVPFWMFEILVEILFVLGYLDIRRIIKFVYEIPKEFIIVNIKFWLGRSSELIFSSKEYDKWLVGRTN